MNIRLYHIQCRNRDQLEKMYDENLGIINISKKYNPKQPCVYRKDSLHIQRAYTLNIRRLGPEHNDRHFADDIFATDIYNYIG